MTVLLCGFSFFGRIYAYFGGKKGEEDKPFLRNGNVSNSFTFKVMRCGTLWIWGSLSQGCNTAGGFSRESKNSSAELVSGPIGASFRSPQSQHLETIALGFLGREPAVPNQAVNGCSLCPGLRSAPQSPLLV